MFEVQVNECSCVQSSSCNRKIKIIIIVLFVVQHTKRKKSEPSGHKSNCNESNQDYKITDSFVKYSLCTLHFLIAVLRALTLDHLEKQLVLIANL